MSPLTFFLPLQLKTSRLPGPSDVLPASRSTSSGARPVVSPPQSLQFLVSPCEGVPTESVRELYYRKWNTNIQTTKLLGFPQKHACQWTDKQNAVQWPSGILSRNRKEQDMDAHCKHRWTSPPHAKWKEPDAKGHIQYDSIYMKCPEKARQADYRHRKQIHGCLGWRQDLGLNIKEHEGSWWGDGMF